MNTQRKLDHIIMMETTRNLNAELMRKAVREMEEALKEMKAKKKDKCPPLRK